MDNELFNKIKKISEAILFDAKELDDLLNKRDGYEDNGVTFVKLINSYLEIIKKSTYDLAKDIFDVVNKLNVTYGVGKSYSYVDYLNQENKKVSKSMVAKILCDDIYFSLFTDFDNNKKYFNQDLEDYLIAIDNFVTLLELKEKSLNSKAQQNFNYLMKKYWMEFKRKHAIYGALVLQSDNPNFEVSIMNKVELNNDNFEIARNIYLELCANFETNLLFPKTENQMVESFRWAKTYAALLNKVKIKAFVCGENNKYVVFDINGILFKANGIQIIKDNYGLNINDLLRTKINFNTVGFSALDEHRDISEKVVEIDKVCGYNPINIKVFNIALNKFYKDNTIDEEFKKKLYLISYHANNNMNGYEWLTYMKMVVNLLFNHEDSNVSYTYAMVRNNENLYNPCMILSINSGNNLMYFYLLKNGKLQFVEKESLEKEIINGSIQLIDNRFVEGLEHACELSLKKKNNMSGNDNT